MSALLDEFRSVLTSYRNEVATWVNQGLVVSIDEHLKRLEAAAPTVEADAQAAVHQILTDLYTAWHAPAQDTPAATEVPAPVAEPAPAPAVVGEPGPQAVALPDGAPVQPAAAEPAQAPAAPAPQSDVLAAAPAVEPAVDQAPDAQQPEASA